MLRLWINIYCLIFALLEAKRTSDNVISEIVEDSNVSISTLVSESGTCTTSYGEEASSNLDLNKIEKIKEEIGEKTTSETDVDLSSLQKDDLMQRSNETLSAAELSQSDNYEEQPENARKISIGSIQVAGGEANKSSGNLIECSLFENAKLISSIALPLDDAVVEPPIIEPITQTADKQEKETELKLRKGDFIDVSVILEQDKTILVQNEAEAESLEIDLKPEETEPVENPVSFDENINEKLKQIASLATGSSECKTIDIDEYNIELEKQKEGDVDKYETSNVAETGQIETENIADLDAEMKNYFDLYTSDEIKKIQTKFSNFDTEFENEIEQRLEARLNIIDKPITTGNDQGLTIVEETRAIDSEIAKNIVDKSEFESSTVDDKSDNEALEIVEELVKIDNDQGPEIIEGEKIIECDANRKDLDEELKLPIEKNEEFEILTSSANVEELKGTNLDLCGDNVEKSVGLSADFNVCKPDGELPVEHEVSKSIEGIIAKDTTNEFESSLDGKSVVEPLIVECETSKIDEQNESIAEDVSERTLNVMKSQALVEIDKIVQESENQLLENFDQLKNEKIIKVVSKLVVEELCDQAEQRVNENLEKKLESDAKSSENVAEDSEEIFRQAQDTVNKLQRTEKLIFDSRLIDKTVIASNDNKQMKVMQNRGEQLCVLETKMETLRKKSLESQVLPEEVKTIPSRIPVALPKQKSKSDLSKNEMVPNYMQSMKSIEKKRTERAMSTSSISTSSSIPRFRSQSRRKSSTSSLRKSLSITNSDSSEIVASSSRKESSQSVNSTSNSSISEIPDTVNRPVSPNLSESVSIKDSLLDLSDTSLTESLTGQEFAESRSKSDLTEPISAADQLVKTANTPTNLTKGQSQGSSSESQVVQEYVSPILDMNISSPKRVKHKFDYVERAAVVSQSPGNFS